MSLKQFDPRGSIACFHHRKALEAEMLADCGAQGILIFHHEDASFGLIDL